MDALKWAGLPRKKAILIGSMAGFLFQSPIEILDGYSAEYGASVSDLAANAAGSLMVLGQYLAWDQIRIQPKFSFHRTQYAAIRPNSLGGNLPEQMLKDYNGQTYWLSCNISTFLKKDAKFPKWINVSLGYGGEGMIYATKSGNVAQG